MRAILTILACLIASPAWAAITYESGTTNTAQGSHFGDSTQTLAWAAPPTSGALIVACAGILSNAITFNAPTGANVTLGSRGSQAASGRTLQCWSGVSTGVAGNITFTTSANDGSTDRIWIYSFTSSNGWTSPNDGFSGSDSTTTTAHDADVSIATTGSADILCLGISFLTSASSSFTLATGYTALTGSANQLVTGYRIDATTGTRTFNNTSGNNQSGSTILASWKENAAAAAGAANQSSMMGFSGR